MTSNSPFDNQCSFDQFYNNRCTSTCNPGNTCDGCDPTKQWDMVSSSQSDCGCDKWITPPGGGLPVCEQWNYRDVCKLRVPQMDVTNPSQEQRVVNCCLGKYNDSQALNVCAPGWCTNTENCYNAMKTHCTVANNPSWNETTGQFETSDCGQYISTAKKEVASKFISEVFPVAFSGRKVTDNNAASLNAYLTNTARLYPGAFSTFLTGYCSTLKRQDLVGRQDYIDLCGCYMPDSEYPFSKELPRACDPACNAPNTVPHAIPGSDTQEICQDSVCLLSDISIDFRNSSHGKVAFNQLCGNSRGKNAKFSQCYFDNVKIDNVDAFLTPGDTVAEGCDICYSGGTDLNPTRISCGGIGGGGGNNGGGTVTKPPRTLGDIFLFGGLGLLGLIVAGIIIWIILRRKK